MGLGRSNIFCWYKTSAHHGFTQGLLPELDVLLNYVVDRHPHIGPVLPCPMVDTGMVLLFALHTPVSPLAMPNLDHSVGCKPFRCARQGG